MKRILVCAATLALCLNLGAKVTLSSVFGDNMVLQQKTDAALWGTADAGSKVTITASWTKARITVTADGDGNWKTTIPTPQAGGPFQMTFSDGDGKTTLSNVLCGEVWFCSGQSNMQMPMKGFDAQPVEGSTEVILSAKKSTPIRICTIGGAYPPVEKKDCKCEWQENTPDAVAGTSATAYFFARQLNATLDIPVGIIISKWGGTRIESWMSREALLEAYPDYNVRILDGDPKKFNAKMPCGLFNGMVAPVIPYTIKGWIWYQGEANRKNPEQYTVLMQAYARMMRERWGLPEMPFYWVQIAPYNYGDENGIDSPFFQEAQEECLDLIPFSGMATTLDVGDRWCIHPCRKQQVGMRLAALALYNDYGVKAVWPKAPRCTGLEVSNGVANVKFEKIPGGLAPLGHPLIGFEIAGADKVFQPAEAIIAKDRASVDVKIPSGLGETVYVRYAYHNYAEGNLMSNWGIPAGPFSTENR